MAATLEGDSKVQNIVIATRIGDPRYGYVSRIVAYRGDTASETERRVRYGSNEGILI